MNIHRIGQVKHVEDNMSGARTISILKRQYYRLSTITAFHGLSFVIYEFNLIFM